MPHVGAFVSNRVVPLLRGEDAVLAIHDAYQCALDMGEAAVADWSFDFDDATFSLLSSSSSSVQGDSLGLATFVSLLGYIDQLNFPYRTLGASAAIRLSEGEWCCEPVADICHKIAIAKEHSIRAFYLSEAQRSEVSEIDCRPMVLRFVPVRLQLAFPFLKSLMRPDAFAN